MGWRISLAVLLLLAASSRAAFAQAAPAASAGSLLTRTTIAPPAPAVISRNVIVVSIDGLRADAIAAANARTLGRLLAEGSGTLTAQTILPSKTLPSHTSMLTGVVPAKHGITWNSDETDEVGAVAVPTVFELAHQAGYSTAAFFSKKKLKHLIKAESLDEVRTPRFGILPASRTVGDAMEYMRRKKPNLLFVHIAEADVIGHRLGFMSTAYRWGVREADAAVAALLDAAEETYGTNGFTLIVTADHGGHGRDHGSDDATDTTIPWISYGLGIRGGHRITGDVRTMDTAATVLRVLGVPMPSDWDGTPVTEALAVTLVTRPAPAASGAP